MTDLNALFQLINPDNTIVANRALAHAIGMAETIIYSALISKYTYYESHEMLIDNEWFFCTTADLQESTTFPPKQQKKAIDKLVEEGLIRVKLAGTPAKRHFSINDDIELIKILIDKGMEKARELTEELRAKIRDDNMKRKLASDRSEGIEKVTAEEDITSGNPLEINRCAKMEHQDAPNGNIKMRQNGASRCADLEHKSKDNKTKANETKDNQSIYLEKEGAFISPQYTKGMAKRIANMRTIEEAVEATIRYGYDALPPDSEVIRNRIIVAGNIRLEWFIDDLMGQNPIDQDKAEMIREIFDLICDVICNKQTVKINGSSYDWDVVRGQLLKLNYEQVRNVVNRMLNDNLEIKNMRPYILTSLYNASLSETIYDSHLRKNSKNSVITK